MTEQLKSLLRDMTSAQDTVTDRNVRAGMADTPEARADLMAEMHWSQGLRDAYRDRILAEFIKLRTERDGTLAALERAEQTFRNLAFGFLDAEANTIAQNEAANIRAAIAYARGEES